MAMDDILVTRLRRPTLLLMPLLALQMVLPQLGLPGEATGLLKHLNGIALIASVVWLLITLVSTLEEILQSFQMRLLIKFFSN